MYASWRYTQFTGIFPGHYQALFSRETRSCGHVTFNSVPTIDQPHERKPVTTEDLSGVHSCISREMNDCFSWVCLRDPTQCSIFHLQHLDQWHTLQGFWGFWKLLRAVSSQCTALPAARNTQFPCILREVWDECTFRMLVSGLHYFISEGSSKIFRGSPYFVVK